MTADDFDATLTAEEVYPDIGPVCRMCKGPATIPVKPVGTETPIGDWCQECYNDIYSDGFGGPASVLGDMIERWETNHEGRKYK